MISEQRCLDERIEGESDESYGTRATEGFISAAFRRQILDEELQSRKNRWQSCLEAGESLDQALLSTWTSILISAHLLLHLPIVDEVRDEFRNARLDSDSLAPRLSCLPWGMSNGNRHSRENLPILLAGRTGGTLRPGRYVDYGWSELTPLSNLYVEMLTRLGVPTQRFGDSIGGLPDLV